MVEGDKDGIRFSARHIAEITVAEDANGLVDTVYRKFKMSARAAAQRFGEDKLPQQMSKDIKNDPHKVCRILRDGKWRSIPRPQ